jgi:ATP-dependent RNA helicase DeaD
MPTNEKEQDSSGEDSGAPLEGIVRDTFDALGLGERMSEACKRHGYETPTDIQQKTIPLVLGTQDVIGQAKTGTGKTAAFALPIIQMMTGVDASPAAIVLTPTRELAVQVAGEIERLGKAEEDFRVLAVYGGASIRPQMDRLAKGVTVVVGTPGRVMDLMRRGDLVLEGVHIAVLDEADRMLDMGFIGDIEWILEKTPKKRQTLLFSATMPDEIRALANRYMRDPVYIRVSSDEDMTVESTEQIYLRVGRRNKIWALSNILDEDEPELTLVFCNTIVAVEMVTRRLHEVGFSVDELHGDLRQTKRERVLDKFRESKVRILVASDVAARGLDIENTSLVVNYDIPEDPESYVHRIGRTSRMGRKGKAVTFVTSNELHLLEAIERWANTKIDLQQLPRSSKRDRVRYITDYDELSNRYGMVSFNLDVGSDDGAKVLDILELVRRATRLPENLIGHIEVEPKHSIVEIDKGSAGRAMGDLMRTRWQGRKVWVDIVEPDLMAERRTREEPPSIYQMPTI